MDEEGRKPKAAARRNASTEGDRQVLRKSGHEQCGSVEAKLRALAVAAENEFPTADIDIMLSEIRAGRNPE